jgi:O-antigen/teichoic acid export membrane protein
VLFAVHRPLLAALYDPSFSPSSTSVALVLAGSLARIASWVPLAALYAMLRTRSIAVGELLSLPLFAALLALSGGALSLDLAGALWLAAFAVYGVFNLWAMRRR